MSRRLLVLCPAELTRDPRARRQAVLGLRLGFDVVGVCGRASGEPPAPLDGVRIVRVGRHGRVDAARHAEGLTPPPSRLLHEALGVYRLVRLVGRTARFAGAALRLGSLDVVHANDFETLPAAAIVARRRRARLVYDAHELYADFEAEPPRLHRAALLALEGALARQADAVVTVSDALAGELARRLRLDRRPHVVLNAPELAAAKGGHPGAEGPLRVVYTGAFGSGRPLADLLDAVAAAPSVRLRLHAVQLPRALLERELGRRALADRVEVAALVPPDRVVDTLAEEHVGVIFDRPVTRNAELSLPNKLFEYMAAGLAVVAPELPAIADVVGDARAGLLFPPGMPQGLADALERLAGDRSLLEELRANAHEAAVTRFNADAQGRALAAAWRAA